MPANLDQLLYLRQSSVVTKYRVWGCEIGPCWFAGRDGESIAGIAIALMHLLSYIVDCRRLNGS
jgi:hypothetical protein